MIARQLEDVRDRNVLLVDDVLDTGKTLGLVVPLIHEMALASVRTCVLLRKDGRRRGPLLPTTSDLIFLMNLWWVTGWILIITIETCRTLLR